MQPSPYTMLEAQYRPCQGHLQVDDWEDAKAKTIPYAPKHHTLLEVLSECLLHSKWSGCCAAVLFRVVEYRLRNSPRVPPPRRRVNRDISTD